MTFKHILVPYDKSETARKALKEAVEIARVDQETKIDVINISPLPELELPSSYSSSLYGGDPTLINVDEVIKHRNDRIDEERREIYDSTKDEFADIEDRVTVTIVPGISPIDDIVEFCDDNGCDLIIMGSRGLGAIRGMLGSVSYGVLRSSKVPVMIMK